MATIELYEDNAGGLTVWDPQRGHGWTGLQRADEDEGTFAEHAHAMALGDDALWLMDPVQSPPGELVASWTDGVVTLARSMDDVGAAAARFLSPNGCPVCGQPWRW